MPIVWLARAYPDDARIGWRNRDVANRSRTLTVENGFERGAVVRSFPNASGGCADVVCARIVFDHRDVINAPAHDCRTDGTKLKILQKRVVEFVLTLILSDGHKRAAHDNE